MSETSQVVEVFPLFLNLRGWITDLSFVSSEWATLKGQSHEISDLYLSNIELSSDSSLIHDQKPFQILLLIRKDNSLLGSFITMGHSADSSFILWATVHDVLKRYWATAQA